MKLDDRLSAALGSAVSAAPASQDLIVVPASQQPRTIDNDFDKARDATLDTIAKATSALDGVLELARSSESPRAYEVAAGFITTINAAAKALLELHEKRSRLETKPIEPPLSGTDVQMTNNIMFAGSARDLANVMRAIGIGGNARQSIDMTPAQNDNES